ncbi:hypothetical protein INR49_027728 [Caranx melampygus]|nr:hypothetical protein INR49_027728 [Caranx melampygus]
MLNVICVVLRSRSHQGQSSCGKREMRDSGSIWAKPCWCQWTPWFPPTDPETVLTPDPGQREKDCLSQAARVAKQLVGELKV